MLEPTPLPAGRKCKRPGSLRAESELVVLFAMQLTGRVRGLAERITELALPDVCGRTVQLRQDEAESRCDGARATPRQTQQDSAEHVSASHEMASRTF